MKPVFNPALPFEVIVKPPFNPDHPFVVDKKPEFDSKKPYQKFIFEEAPPKEVKALTKEDVLMAFKEELSKIKLPEKVIEKTVIERPAEIVREVTKEVFKKDEEIYAEIENIRKRIEEINFNLLSTPMPGGPGVIGIPPPEGNENKVLTVVNNKANWKATSSGGSLTPGAYTLSNDTTLRTLDVSNYTMDDLSNLVSTLIRDLGGV